MCFDVSHKHLCAALKDINVILFRKYCVLWLISVLPCKFLCAESWDQTKPTAWKIRREVKFPHSPPGARGPVTKTDRIEWSEREIVWRWCGESFLICGERQRSLEGESVLSRRGNDLKHAVHGTEHHSLCSCVLRSIFRINFKWFMWIVNCY